MVERVQLKFLHHTAYKLNIPYHPHDCSPIQQIISLESLADPVVRHSENIAFPTNLLSFKIYCPESLSRISLYVPSRRTHFSVPFHIQFSSSKYFHNAQIIRIMHIANTNPSSLSNIS